MTTLILFLLLFSFCLGQLGRFSLFRPDLVFHVNDLMVGIVVISCLLFKILKKEKIHLPKIFKAAVSFFLIGLISLLLNLRNYLPTDVCVAALYLLRWFIYAMLIVVVHNFVTKDNKQKKRILNLLIIGGTITAIIGLFQYLFFPDLRPLKEIGWDPHLYRVVGSFFDPGFIGAILVLNLILIISLIIFNPTGSFDSPRTVWYGALPRMTLFLSLLVSYPAMVLTYSRSSYLMFLTSMAIISLIRKSIKFFLLVILIFALTLKVIPQNKSYGTTLDRQETGWARLENWKTSFEIFKKNPFFGVGFNNYRYAQIKYGYILEENSLQSHAAAGADNSFLFVLATTGVLGFLAYLWLWGEIIKLLTEPMLLRKKQDFLRISFLISIVGIFIQSLFINSLFYPFIMEWLWALMSLSLTFKENT